MNKHYLTRQESASYLSDRGLLVTKNTLQKFATVGGGPEYSIFGNRALYTPPELGCLGRGEAHCVSQIDERGCVMARAIKRRAPGTPL